MKKNTTAWTRIRNAIWACGIALFSASAPCLAQSARLASLEFTPNPAKKELAVGFRLVDAEGVTSVRAATEGKGESLTATWEAWEGDKAPACAWMIVVDTSDRARARTVASGVDFVRSFVTGLPKQDKVAIFTLALNLEEVSPFGSTPEDRSKSLAGIKPGGDASKTTLIFTNLREGLKKLEVVKDTRKAVLLLTDGKDETPGGPTAQEIERKKLIDAAKAAGIAVHSVGYAESAADQAYFAGLKEISGQTDGLFVATALAVKDAPPATSSLLRGVMHGAGIVRIDLSKLTEPTAITVTAKTADKKTIALQVPSEKVAAAMGASPADIAKLAKEKADKEAKEKADKEAKEKADKEAKAKADKEAKAKADEEAEKPKGPAVPKDPPPKAAVPIWVWAGSGAALVILIAAMLMLRAARKRAAEEAQSAEYVRMAEEERLSQEARRSQEPKKTEAPPLSWIEMCDAQQTRHPVRITSLKIGRGQHNDLVFRNDSVSGNHCVINCNREGEWSITDLNAGNGVVLNGARVKQSVLRHGDTIELGELKMRFLLRV